MPSRRRTELKVAELIFGLVGVGFMMLVMFCFLPGGGGAKAAEALEKTALSIVVAIAFMAIFSLFAFALFSKWRRSRPKPVDLQNWDLTLAPNNCFRVETKVDEDAQKSVRRSNPASLNHDDLIAQVRKIDWFQFEKLVAMVYGKLGYAVEQRGGANPDGGIDLILQKDGERIAAQCKHWQNRDIGVATIREFLGALADAGIKKGIFVTLNGYTGDAKQLAARHGIEILNQTKLVEMLETADVRFAPQFRQLLTDTRKNSVPNAKAKWLSAQPNAE